MVTPSLPRASHRLLSLAPALGGALVVVWMATVSVAAQAPQPGVRSRPKSEMQQAVETYRLSAGDLQKVTVANDRLATAIANNPGAVQELKLQSEGAGRANLDDMIRKAEANPVISSAIHSAGLDVRGYLVAMSSMVVANAYSQMMQRNPQMSAKMSGMISPAEAENMKLLQAHPAEAKAFEQSLEKLKQVDDEMSKHAHGNGGR